MTTHGTYEEIANVFDEMLEVLNDKYDDNRLITDKYIAVILVKGDYLNPPMLEEGSEPECEMMRAEANFAGTRDFELEIGLRSSFVRQYMNEWHSTREIVHKVESRFAPQNIRYFVSSALGQSTRPRMTVNEADIFNMGTGAAGDDPAADFNAGDQLLLRQASPKHVIDPVCWYLLKNKLI